MSQKITGIPGFTGITDPNLVTQLSLIWQALIGLSADAAALPSAASLTALQSAVAALQSQANTTQLLQQLMQILTTKGDLLTRSGSAYTRIGVGANNTLPVADSTQAVGWKWANILSLLTTPGSDYQELLSLASAATGVTWDTRPCCIVAHSANQTFASGGGAANVLAMDTDIEANSAIHSVSTNNSRLTINRAGVWGVFSMGRWSADSAGNYRETRVYKNGSASGTIIGDDVRNVAASSATRGPDWNIATIRRFIVGDYLETYILHDSTNTIGALTAASGANQFSPIFGAIWLMP